MRDAFFGFFKRKVMIVVSPFLPESRFDHEICGTVEVCPNIFSDHKMIPLGKQMGEDIIDHLFGYPFTMGEFLKTVVEDFFFVFFHDLFKLFNLMLGHKNLELKKSGFVIWSDFLDCIDKEYYDFT